MPTYEDNGRPPKNVELDKNILTKEEKKEFLKIDSQHPGKTSLLLNYLEENGIKTSGHTALKFLEKLKKSQIEAQKSPSQRGQSEPANTIVNGIAIGNLVKAHQLKEMREINEKMDEMTEDVDDVNEGFEFDF